MEKTLRASLVTLLALMLISAFLLVAGCAKKSQVPAEQAVSESGPSISSEEVTPGAEEATELSQLKDIYFDYDKYTIRSDARATLRANYEVLKDMPRAKVLIEGHCDERGSKEYNLALGQRRADAAKEYLVGLGIEPTQLSTISYGKEKPMCTEHTEDCWAMNRRAHFVLIK